MSFYELDRPATSGQMTRIGGIFAPLRAMVASMARSFAYARMIRAMYEMDDATLARIGVTRAQIPAYVDQCLAGDSTITS